MKLDFLLSISESQKVRVNPQISRSISKCINKTLSFLSTSAIFDHVGGGFFRYATQKDWSLPHYEKILSENALLIATFSNAYRKYRNKDYSRIILETLSWLNREMGTLRLVMPLHFLQNPKIRKEHTMNGKNLK